MNLTLRFINVCGLLFKQGLHAGNLSSARRSLAVTLQPREDGGIPKKPTRSCYKSDIVLGAVSTCDRGCRGKDTHVLSCLKVTRTLRKKYNGIGESRGRLWVYPCPRMYSSGAQSFSR